MSVDRNGILQLATKTRNLIVDGENLQLHAIYQELKSHFIGIKSHFYWNSIDKSVVYVIDKQIRSDKHRSRSSDKNFIDTFKHIEVDKTLSDSDDMIVELCKKVSNGKVFVATNDLALGVRCFEVCDNNGVKFIQLMTNQPREVYHQQLKGVL